MRNCPHCRRANPDDAVYCHHDGIVLRGAESPAHPSKAPDRFQREWLLASGRRCLTRADLVEACLAEWESARGSYAAGQLGRFLQEASQGQWMPAPMPLAQLFGDLRQWATARHEQRRKLGRIRMLD